MKRKTKILVSALSVMLVMVLAVTIVSFSLASRQNEPEMQDTTLMADAADDTNMTMVDRIIENSNLDEDANDPYYHIVEIGSSASPSMATLPDGSKKSYLEYLAYMDADGVSAFKNYVIDGNKTIEQLMKEGRIDYKYYHVTSVTAADIETIAEADLIYVSNDPNNMFAAGTNDLSEDLYSALLHTYVNNKQRPMIIDNPIETEKINGTQQRPTMGKLGKDVFEAKGSRYYTFAWDTSKNALDAAGTENFLSHKNGSLYLGINGNNKVSNWTQVVAGDATPGDAATSLNMAKVLIIAPTADSDYTNNPHANALFTGFGAAETVKDATGTEYDVYRLYNTVDGERVDTLFYSSAYNSRYTSKPDVVTVEECTLTDLDANLDSYDFDKYDMIIMESGLTSTSISTDLYRKFSAAMLANVTIIYNSGMKSGSANTGNDDFDATASKYNMLYATVASTSGVSKKPNVMVTNAEDFGVIAQSNSAATCKKIADLINASAFREYGGANSSSTKFTVLELQPCYPIDLEVAESNPTPSNSTADVLSGYLKTAGIKGNYYTVPAEVLNAPKEQISTVNADGTITTPEYYAWELSEAKIADALGMDINNVQVVHMSSEEMAASTTDILGTYDLVYIGGNRSALKEATQWKGVDGTNNSSPIGSGDGLRDINKIKYLPIFTMYTHNGDLTIVNVNTAGESGGVVQGGQAFASLDGRDPLTTLNGNDITYKQGQKLVAYVASGMPVIVSDDAAEGYQALVDAEDKDGNPYLQNSIDPDCNMAKVLAECYNQYTKKSQNVLWGFDKDGTCHVDNAGGALGTTNVGYVEVFASEFGSDNIDDGTTVTGQKEKIADVYNVSYKRPILEVTKTPKRYDDTKADSTVDIVDGKSVLEFEYTIKGSSKCEVKLWIDDDGNGRYGDATDLSYDGTDTSLRVEMADSFYGPISWKLEAKDTVTGITTGITGISYVAPKRVEDKQNVRVLQIMPGGKTQGSSKVLGEGAEGSNSLYFCVVCQQACERLEKNPLANNASWFQIHYSGNYYTEYSTSAEIQLPWPYPSVTIKDVGTHEHVFGIPYYDANLQFTNNGTKYGADDWHINLADDLSDRFDFDIDILTRGEVEEISDNVRAAYDFSKMSDAEKLAVIKKFEDNVDLEDKEFEDYAEYGEDDVDEKLTYITQYNSEVYASEYWNLYTYMRDEKAVADSFEDVNDPDANPANPDAGNAGNGGSGEQNKTFTDPITGASIEITQTTLDAKTDLNEMLEKLITSLEAKGRTELVEEVQYIIRTERYYDLFNASYNGNFAFRYGGFQYYLSAEDINKLCTAFTDYVKAKNTELEYKELYKKYDREAHANNWIEGCYSTVLIGPSEDFAGDDFTAGSNGLKDLTNYVKSDGNVLLFHDTFTRFGDAGSVNLTTALRPYAGQDKNHMVAEDTSNQYVKYKVADGYDEHKYFMTNLSYKTGDEKYPNWINDLNAYQGSSNGKGTNLLTSIAYTDGIYSANHASSQYAVAYKYAHLSWAYSAHWQNAASADARENNQYGTNRGSKNNDGLITLYPYTLSDDIYIAGTHPQAYALDLEDDKCTVWYSLAGGYNDQKGSSMFAASPRDGQDNYFIYSYKNVYYCGAGHSNVTGVGKMNNDERKLYINIICNAVRKSAAMPSIYIYDYDKDTYGEKIKRKDGSYYTKVDDTDEYPEFSFKATTDSESTLERIRIYYDLDYSDENRSNAFVDNDEHVLVADWNANSVTAGVRKNVYRYDPTLKTLVDQNGNPVIDSTNADGSSNIASALKLKPEYFDPYNGEYTYIVIEATDSGGNKVYQRIKVMLKDVLFNLT